jgi:hypothetical protein
MPELPSYVEEHMRESILGRARLKLYQLISGREHLLPEANESRRFVRSEFRGNPAVGKIFLTLLKENTVIPVSFSELAKPTNISLLLDRLERAPLRDSTVVEVQDCPKSLPSKLGLCIHKERLADGGYVYVATLFDDERFPEAFSGRVEIRACANKRQPVLSVWSGSAFDHYDETDFEKSWYAGFLIEVLDYLNKNRPSSLVPLSQVNETEFKEDDTHRPPEDKLCTQYIVRVLNNELVCTLTTVLLEKIKPFSLDFCLTYPTETVEWEIKQIRRGEVAAMCVYWDTDHFVMSDDYSAYLAHRSLKSQTVPVAIMGKFPKKLAIGTITTGGPELIPPLRIMQRENYDSLPPEIKLWLIDARLQHKKVSHLSATLAATAMVLSKILSEAGTDEKRIHRFLAQNPLIVDAYGTSIRSELRLGDQYRVDLAIQYNLDDKRLLLIELEHPKAPIFTKKGRPRSHVTHALQQVEDWLQWWREHPDDVPSGLDPSIPIEGLVVIGRNRDLTEQDKRRLLHLNSTRDVTLITYDQLLEKIEILIQNLESLDQQIDLRHCDPVHGTTGAAVL